MSQAARQTAAADSQRPPRTSARTRGARLPAFLVTLDDALWPQIGPRLEGECMLRQIDTLEELEQATSVAQPGVVLWDVREAADRAEDLARLRRHPRLALIVLDAAANAALWKDALLAQQVSSVLSVPIEPDVLMKAFTRARAAAQSHPAIEVDVSATDAPPPRRRALGIGAMLGAATALAVTGGYLWYRSSSAPPPRAASPHPAGAPPAATPARGPAAGTPEAQHAADEQVDSLLDRARQAMRDRHYIDPPDQNALAYYQGVLLYDRENGEARQGLERLAQILFARVQTDLNDKRYDLALQALETARSIRPDDPHLKLLDARIAQLRAELGSSQIQAAINAMSFDRALELLDEAARARSLPAARIAQMREEVHRLQASSDASRFVKLLETRMQQDRLLEPREDSALYYLQQARAAGAGDLQEPTGALEKRLLADARTALDQHRIGEAEALLGAARDLGTPPSKALAALQRELEATRDSQARDKAQRAEWLEAARARIAQGALVTPANDSALYYFEHVRSADPANAELPSLSTQLLSALIAQGRAALDAGDLTRADTLVKAAASIGASGDLDALKTALGQKTRTAAAPAVVSAASLVALKPLKLDYPHGALANGTEGWVDLAFTVTTEGKVTDIVVVDASPRGVFDAAARSAIARVRYQPVLLDGKPIEVQASLHVTFRLSNR